MGQPTTSDSGVRAGLWLIDLRSDGQMGLGSVVWDPCEFWEGIGALGRVGEMGLRVIRRSVGGLAVYWWYVMAPEIDRLRASTSDDRVYEDFEWLVREVERGNPEDFERQEAMKARSTPESLDIRIGALEERIREHETLRSAPGPTTSSSASATKSRTAARQRPRG